MKLAKTAFASTLILLAVAVSGTALAGPHGHHGHRGGVRLSLGIGVPLGIGYYGYYGAPYYSPYYAPYYPSYYPAVSAPYAPAYVEQAVPQIAPQAAPSNPESYWYYCADSRAYYPYVNQCASGWQRVSPTPPVGG